jgi:hypothetical protein
LERRGGDDQVFLVSRYKIETKRRKEEEENIRYFESAVRKEEEKMRRIRNF